VQHQHLNLSRLQNLTISCHPQLLDHQMEITNSAFLKKSYRPWPEKSSFD
jgi:hypothetical protein